MSNEEKEIMENFMEQSFIDILKQIVKEQINAVLNDSKQLKAILADYTKNEYKKESRRLIQAVEAGVAKAIKEADDLPSCKKAKINELMEDYDLSQEVSAAIVDTLALVLRGDTSKSADPIQTVSAASSANIAGQEKKSDPSGNMVRIIGGTFTMGSPGNEKNRSSNEVQHPVTLGDFYMGKYPVTQKEYQEVMWTNPSNFKGDNLPVEMVSWYDAIEYCNKRSQKEGLIPAYTVNGENVTWNSNTSGYRLPTEAEWEYACRAGTLTAYNTGEGISYNTGWYDKNSGGETHPVGEYPANAWELYDMHGNVYEWCWDWYGDYTKKWNYKDVLTDPQGESTGHFRISRGGCWKYDANLLRSAYRGYHQPTDRENCLGFRLVRP
jgi:formylglycine-generating enzyme required for sulfatase activity